MGFFQLTENHLVDEILTVGSIVGGSLVTLVMGAREGAKQGARQGQDGGEIGSETRGETGMIQGVTQVVRRG